MFFTLGFIEITDSGLKKSVLVEKTKNSLWPMIREERMGGGGGYWLPDGTDK